MKKDYLEFITTAEYRGEVITIYKHPLKEIYFYKTTICCLVSSFNSKHSAAVSAKGTIRKSLQLSAQMKPSRGESLDIKA